MQSTTQPIRKNRLANLLIEASPVGMVMTDAHGIIALVNQIAESWFGYQENELVGKPMELLVPPLHRSAHVSQQACFMSQPHARPMATGQAIHAKRKDGTEFPIRVTLHPLNTISGEMILANLTNLSQDDPEQKARIQGERLAAILEMVSGLAHESNNALQRARACLDLLEMDLGQNPDALDLTNRIGEALDDLHRNYKNVKNYAAPITLKLTQEINLPQSCQTVFDELVDEFQATQRLAIQCDESCVQWKVDAARINQVLRAVLENAFAASPDGGIIKFSCRLCNANDPVSIVMTVRDHGSGFTNEVAARMFEPFFTTKQHGTGLGLAVCRRIVEAHGGNMTAENHPNGGAVVRVVIPR